MDLATPAVRPAGQTDRLRPTDRGGGGRTVVLGVPGGRTAPALRRRAGQRQLVTTQGWAMRILVIDNYDSFVYNLVQYLGQLGVECDVRRNDEITVAEVGQLKPTGVLLSPGPGTPDRAGIMLDLIKAYSSSLPLFGVCLGHQAIGEAFGAVVTRAPELLHGKTSEVTHNGVGVLAGLPDPFTATRYHSLAVLESTLPDEIEVTGRTT